MVNLKAFIDSMKLTWIRRSIISDSPWQSVVENVINFKELFSFGKKYVESQFWIDVLKAYSEILKFVNEQDKEEAILSSPLFYNHEINIGGKPLWIKNWYTNGIRYVNDLLTETGDFYSQAVLERTYNIKTNFVQFQGIKQAVKLYGRRYNIRNFTKQLLCPIIPANITLITKSRKGGKDFYTILNRNEDKPTSQAKWENIYSIEEETWKTIYYSPFQIFIGTKLQWFQIRINHRILPTKKFLYTIKYIQSPNCNFCQEEETINHMFWNCQESQSLIREFSRWLNNKNIHLTFVEELFIFNIGNNYSMVELQIFIIIKYYMYTAKRLSQRLLLVTLLNKIKYFHKLEKYTATKNNCLDKFERKWVKYNEALQSIH